MKLKNNLHYIIVSNFTTESGVFYPTIKLSYHLFGAALYTAPIVLINHALTGNSQVTGLNGWWNDLIGETKTIDTQKYSVLAFNVPGNGMDNDIIDSYKDFTARDIARLFIYGIAYLEIEQLFAIVGGSVGGGIGWEMVALASKITKNFIPIATDWKASDWVIANCFLQEQILLNSSQPIEDARTHAMMCYRTPESLKEKFNTSLSSNLENFSVESWLMHHGEKLQKRFQIAAYKMMNHVLKSIDITRNRSSFEEVVSAIEANIHIVAIDSDLFFTSNESKNTYKEILKLKKNVSYHEINSIHGHDAFLIEYNQLNTILSSIFKISKQPCYECI